MSIVNESTSIVHHGLWLVATPIGNLDDISIRSVSVLRACSIVCCEDTRRSGSLLKHIGARPERLVVTNEHTENDVISVVLDYLARDISVALISDAGTPGISDPGQHLISSVHKAGFKVYATPGPVAFVMAAVISGLPTTRIAFDGFLPRTGALRRERITEIARERRTTVLYEAPHRLARTLNDLASTCDLSREIVLARELTKMHEDLWRGTLKEALVHVGDVEPRGEYAIVIAPFETITLDIQDDDIVEELNRRLQSGLTKRDAINEVTNALGIARKRVYALAVAL